MVYDRRNLQLRSQYNDLVRCLKYCSNNNTCGDYVLYSKTNGCVWKYIIDKDIDRIKNNREIDRVKFPLLEVILEREKGNI